MNIVAQPSLLSRLISKEEARQKNNVELIASENFVSPEVRNICASVLTHKYAEGYPQRRYYGGCEVIDEIEVYTQDLAKELFSAEYANVQPHSGSSANMAVFHAFLKPGDKILGMDLAHGGHLTHGAAVSFSGTLYQAHYYGVRKDNECIDYDEVRSLARKIHPKMIIAGASSYPRIIDFQIFRDIADEVGAMLFVDMAHIAGLVAVGLHPSPLPYAHVVSTTTHKTLRGPRGGMILVGEDGPNIFGLKAKKSGRIKKLSELIDSAVIPGIQGGPLMHIVAAKACALEEALDPSFVGYQNAVVRNARTLANELQERGARVVTGTTDNHIVLIEISHFDVDGREAEKLLDTACITVNKNVIPFDTRGPLKTSGIRMGTPAVTTRGMTEADMKYIAECIVEVLQKKEGAVKEIAQRVRALTASYPLFVSERR